MSADNIDTISLTSSDILSQQRTLHEKKEVEVKRVDSSKEEQRCKHQMPYFQILAFCVSISLAYSLGRSRTLFNLPEINDNNITVSEKNAAISATKNVLIKKRHIAIFGLESSGTQFFSQTIAKASGIYPRESKKLIGEYGEPRDDVGVLHQSLPWGETCQSQKSRTIPYWLPAECRCENHMFYEQECSHLGFNKCSSLAIGRHMVNITNHIQWYQKQGSIATALIVVRDKNIELASSSRLHCTDAEKHKIETKDGVELMREAISSLSSKPNIGNIPSVVIASYETLNALGAPYLFHLYEELGISTDFIPIIKDGNARYVPKALHGPRNLRVNDHHAWTKVDEQIFSDFLTFQSGLMNEDS